MVYCQIQKFQLLAIEDIMFNSKGFSLLELMMVLAITSIIAGLIYSNYSDRVLRARRLDGKISLMDLAQKIERLSLSEHTYKFNPKINNSLPKQSINGWYLLSILEASDQSFTVQARPIPSQKDIQCEAFTLNQVGHKGLTAGPWGYPTAIANNCWN